jgi:hypothetical protein
MGTQKMTLTASNDARDAGGMANALVHRPALLQERRGELREHGEVYDPGGPDGKHSDDHLQFLDLRDGAEPPWIIQLLG